MYISPRSKPRNSGPYLLSKEVGTETSWGGGDTVLRHDLARAPHLGVALPCRPRRWRLAVTSQKKPGINNTRARLKDISLRLASSNPTHENDGSLLRRPLGSSSRMDWRPSACICSVIDCLQLVALMHLIRST
jgi:hypothetical protein